MSQVQSTPSQLNLGAVFLVGCAGVIYLSTLSKTTIAKVIGVALLHLYQKMYPEKGALLVLNESPSQAQGADPELAKTRKWLKGVYIEVSEIWAKCKNPISIENDGNRMTVRLFKSVDLIKVKVA